MFPHAATLLTAGFPLVSGTVPPRSLVRLVYICGRRWAGVRLVVERATASTGPMAGHGTRRRGQRPAAA